MKRKIFTKVAATMLAVVMVISSMSFIATGCATGPGGVQVDTATQARWAFQDIEDAMSGVEAVIKNHGGEIPEAYVYARDAFAIAKPIVLRRLDRLAEMQLSQAEQDRATEIRARVDELAGKVPTITVEEIEPAK